MIRTSTKLAIAALLPLALSACGGGSSKGTTATTTTTTTPAASTFQDKAGTAFAALFNTATTADARHPTAADVPALSLTTEPFDN